MGGVGSNPPRQEWENIELTFDSLILEKVDLLVQLLSHANPRDPLRKKNHATQPSNRKITRRNPPIEKLRDATLQ